MFDSFRLLRRLDPEIAHALALGAIRLGLTGRGYVASAPVLPVSVFGLEFRNPIGLAAGFDKNGVAIDGLARLGFGFLETGTVTLRSQPGNARPRIFRLEEDSAVINRLGFNNSGLDAYLKRLAARTTRTVPVGANVGINREGADPERDYPALVNAVSTEADYVVVNVSSPNTTDLRSWQSPKRLEALLCSISHLGQSTRPLLLKVSPDLAPGELEALVEICISGGVQGLILTNTTVARPATLRSKLRDQLGGLSGAPLFAPSTAMLARAFELARGRLKLIGVGGVSSGRDALTKIQAGAHLVQFYTAFAYKGPDFLPRALDELAEELHRRGFKSVEEAVGSDSQRLARQ